MQRYLMHLDLISNLRVWLDFILPPVLPLPRDPLLLSRSQLRPGRRLRLPLRLLLLLLLLSNRWRMLVLLLGAIS